MRVIVKHGSHKTYELDVSPRESVASLKARVEGWGGPPFYQQRLVWGGTELEDQDAKLGSYGLREDGSGKVYVIGLSLMFPPAPDWEPFPLGRFCFFLPFFPPSPFSFLYDTPSGVFTHDK